MIQLPASKPGVCKDSAEAQGRHLALHRLHSLNNPLDLCATLFWHCPDNALTLLNTAFGPCTVQHRRQVHIVSNVTDTVCRTKANSKVLQEHCLGHWVVWDNLLVSRQIVLDYRAGLRKWQREELQRS